MLRANLWNSTDRPGDAVVLRDRGNGQYVVHCCGSPDWWEARWGELGNVLGRRISDLPAADRNGVLVMLIEEDTPGSTGARQRRRIPMDRPVPPGAEVVASNLVPHAWQGEDPEDVR
jgi:hypothetical protein